MSEGRVQNIVLFGDTHVDCKMGLCPDEGFALDEGGRYMPSPLQRVVYSWWREFWDVFVPTATRGEPFIGVHMGDAMDGDHHGSTSTVTRNMKDQVRHAHQVLAPYVARCQRYYHIRGTEAHVGKSAEHEEALAERLGAVPKDGQHSRWELILRLGDRRIHLAHHISVASSPFSRSTALRRMIVNSYVDTGKRGAPPYALMARAHCHQHSIVSEEAGHSKVTALTTPAWQLKGPYVHSKDSLQFESPEIGGVVIRLADDELFTRAFVRRPDPPADEVI